MNYYGNLFASRPFSRRPLGTLLRGAHLSVLVALKRGAVIPVRFGSTTFRFRYVHGERHGGGRGVFVGREVIEDLMEFGDRFLKVGDVAIDGGANQGSFTTAFATYVGPFGRVVAVEPMPYAVRCIEENARLNGLRNVTVYRNALSDRRGEALLDLSEGVGSASITRAAGDGAPAVPVETITIDDIVAEQGLSRLDFLKLDVEGAEAKAIRGALGSIDRFRPIVCMEMLELPAPGEDDAWRLLLDRGYTGFAFEDGALREIGDLKPPYVNLFLFPPSRPAAHAEAAPALADVV